MKRIFPLFISIIIHIFLIAISVAVYLSFIDQKRSHSEEKIYIQLNNIAHYAQNDVKQDLQKSIKKVQKFEKTKPKITTEEKEFIKIDEEIKKQKDKPKEKVLLNTTIEKKIRKEKKKSLSKEITKVDFIKQYLDENKDLIVKLLKENLYYPRSAVKRGIIGEVVVKFTLTKDSLVHSLETISSKSDILSRGALKTISNLSGKFPAPKEEITLIVPINYALK